MQATEQKTKTIANNASYLEFVDYDDDELTQGLDPKTLVIKVTKQIHSTTGESDKVVELLNNTCYNEQIPISCQNTDPIDEKPQALNKSDFACMQASIKPDYRSQSADIKCLPRERQNYKDYLQHWLSRLKCFLGLEPQEECNPDVNKPSSAPVCLTVMETQKIVEEACESIKDRIQDLEKRITEKVGDCSKSKTSESTWKSRSPSPNRKKKPPSKSPEKRRWKCHVIDSAELSQELSSSSNKINALCSSPNGNV